MADLADQQVQLWKIKRVCGVFLCIESVPALSGRIFVQRIRYNV